MELWTGPPGPNARVVGTALVSRVVPPKSDELGDTASAGCSVAVEVYGGVFEQGVCQEDYEASDLLYQSGAYSEYVDEHFAGMGTPTTLGRLQDLQQLYELSVCFLWSALCTRVEQ